LENAQQALALFQQTAIEVLPADRKTVLAAAHIKANYAISYADAFVAAAAIEHNAPIITGDPEFESLGGLIEISKLT
jgi:ribonuclease VapC